VLFLNKEETNKYLHALCPPEMQGCLDSFSFKEENFPCRIKLDDTLCHRYNDLAKSIIDWMAPFSTSVLLVTEYGIFPSRENLHLFQRLRASYSNNDPVFISPGHLFLRFEIPDLITFFYLCILFSWGGIVAVDGLKMAVFSHDGWLGLIGDGCDEVVTNWLGEPIW
jgi:hypothetical protein